jgi:hypothetical protein
MNDTDQRTDRELFLAILAAVEDLRRLLVRPLRQHRLCSNDARDLFFEARRREGVSWPTIHGELLALAPARGWAIVANGRACAAAYYRLLARRRRLAAAMRPLRCIA